MLKVKAVHAGAVLMLVIAGMVACVFDNTQQAQKEQDDADAFVGSEACTGCHKEIYNEHIHSNHFKSSGEVDNDTLHQWSKGNQVMYKDGAYVKVEAKKNDFWQVQFKNKEERVMGKKMDIQIGAGKKGITYLYWQDSALFQLPAFYFTPHKIWANSPGFPSTPLFTRTITSRCLECHATYAEVTTPERMLPEKFKKNSIVWGVDCERCHGPAKKHVQYHTQHTGEKLAAYIRNPAGFSRQQKIDMCALCHGGTLNKRKPAFSFQPGDTLTRFFTFNLVAPNIESLDVHGNQYGLLSLSKCYLSSEMTCNSCHASHKNENSDKVTFSQRCITCHQSKHTNLAGLKNPVSMQKNCVDCHMPEKESKTIVFSDPVTQKQLAAKMTTHLVKIYPEQSKKIIEYLNSTEITKK